MAFIERGVHVLVEKPLARTVEEADRLVNAAAVRGVTLAVGHTERFNPAVAAARRLLHGPRFIEAHRLGTFPERSLDIDVVFDLMIHDLDIVLSIVGEPTVSVEAVGVPVLTPRIDIANVRLRFAGGCIANLTASRISRDRIRKIRFFQPQAYLSVDYAAQEIEHWTLGPPDARQSAAVDPGRQARGRQGRAAAPRTGGLRHRGARRPAAGRDRRAGPRSAAAGGGHRRADAAWSALSGLDTLVEAVTGALAAGSGLDPAQVAALAATTDVLALGALADDARRRPARRGARRSSGCTSSTSRRSDAVDAAAGRRPPRCA